MRILAWYWGRRGGGAKYAAELARALDHVPGVELHLSFSRQADVFDEVRTITPRRFDVDTYTDKKGFVLSSLKLPLLASRFARYVKQNRIDTVLTAMPHLWTPLVLPFLKAARVPHILTIHDATAHPGDLPVVNAMNRAMIAMSTKVVVLSGHVREQVVSNFRVDPGRIIESRHGILNYKGLVRRAWDFSTGPVPLVFFGRILPYKGLGRLVDAYAELVADHPELSLEIYGAGDISEYGSKLENLPGVHLENRWIGDDEISAIFNKPCLNVAPYVEASQSGTIPVAASCGIPSIASDVGGLSEQVLDGKTGFLYPPGQSGRNLAGCVKKALNNRALLSEMSENCLDWCESELSWPKIAGDLVRNIKVA